MKKSMRDMIGRIEIEFTEMGMKGWRVKTISEDL